MPAGRETWGGPRPGGGRPKGSKNAKHQITTAQIGTDGYLPIEYMLALMRDEKAEPQRRDAMAIQAAPYCHARLNAVARTDVKGAGAGDINIVQIYAVPRGAALNVKDDTITIDGEATPLESIEPFQGTPALTEDTIPGGPDGPSQAVPDSSVSPPMKQAEPLPVINIDTANVTRLDTYRERED